MKWDRSARQFSLAVSSTAGYASASIVDPPHHCMVKLEWLSF
jgi:hypothetical protein